MEEKDYIKDLFAEKLSNAEAPVNPELWSAISSKIGTASVVSTGLSIAAKWLIGLGTAASVAVATVLLVDKSDAKTVSKKEKNSVESKQDESSKDVSDKVSAENSNSLVNDSKSNSSSERLIVCKFGDIVEVDEIVPNIENVFEDNSVISEKHENVYIEPIVETIDKSEKPSDNVVKPVVTSSFEIKQLTNTFTINNDGNNDLFFLEMKGIEDFVLTILDSKNEIVFMSTDTNFKWDGLNLRGEQIPAGKYVYFFTGKDSQGNPISKSSNLTVIKN